MTPQSRRELAAATDLIGYGPISTGCRCGRISAATPATTPTNPNAPGWHANWRSGGAVAVVSSGDPGVFAMATAVLEEAKQWPDVAVRVIPAMTAAQAVASRVGALGHDYAVIRCPIGSSHGMSSPPGCPRRPRPTRAGDLQPGVEEPDLAGGGDARPAAGTP